MRIFDILNFQHVVAYVFPALAFILIFAAGLAYAHIRRSDSAGRFERVIEHYAGGIEGRNAPFPLALILIIAGTVPWCLLYIILTGLMGIKI
jgi:hypothetical protein